MKTHNMILYALFAALTAIGAFIKIPIPVCPFTMQLFFTTMSGMLLGANGGFISVLVYIIIGLAGVPVFTQGGGPAYVLQPTFGYIIGFAVGAFITGKIVYSGRLTLKRLFAGGFAGLGTVYIFGMVYYYIIANYVINTPIAAWTVFVYCFIAAVPGDIVLTILVSLTAKKLIPALRRGHINAAKTV